jgi:hypothetical protein
LTTLTFNGEALTRPTCNETFLVLIFTSMKSFLIPLLFATTASLAQIATQATPVDKIKVAKGFKVELLYSVPKEQQGSWVSMTQDDKGRLICSDQYGALYRITPPAIGGSPGETKIEKLSIDFGHCQGLLYHAGALYGVVNDDAYQGRGLYRCSDTNGDDTFDKPSISSVATRNVRASMGRTTSCSGRMARAST